MQPLESKRKTLRGNEVVIAVMVRGANSSRCFGMHTFPTWLRRPNRSWPSRGVASGRLAVPSAGRVEYDALRSGYCTADQVMSAVACTSEGHAGSPEEIAEFMRGNCSNPAL